MPINSKHPLENKTPEKYTKNKRQKISDNPIIEEKSVPNNTKIFEEAKKGNFEGIKSCVEQGINIDTTDRFGMTVLHRVIQAKQTELAKGNPPQKQSTRRVEFSNNKKGDSINDNIKTQ